MVGAGRGLHHHPGLSNRFTAREPFAVIAAYVGCLYATAGSEVGEERGLDHDAYSQLIVILLVVEESLAVAAVKLSEKLFLPVL